MEIKFVMSCNETAPTLSSESWARRSSALRVSVQGLKSAALPLPLPRSGTNVSLRLACYLDMVMLV
jgi:hypothetical protein